MVMIPILGTRAVFDPEIAGFRFDGQRRRRSLISAQGCCCAPTLGQRHHNFFKPCNGYSRTGLTLSAFDHYSFCYPGLSLRSNPGLKLANAFGVARQNEIRRFPDQNCTRSENGNHNH